MQPTQDPVTNFGPDEVRIWASAAGTMLTATSITLQSRLLELIVEPIVAFPGAVVARLPGDARKPR